MALDELLGLHEHTAGAAARVVDASLERFEHLHHQSDNGTRRIEFPTTLSLGSGELAEEVLVNAPEHVERLTGLLAHRDVREQVDQLAEHDLVEGGSGIVLRQNAFE